MSPLKILQWFSIAVGVKLQLLHNVSRALYYLAFHYAFLNHPPLGYF